MLVYNPKQEKQKKEKTPFVPRPCLQMLTFSHTQVKDGGQMMFNSVLRSWLRTGSRNRKF